MIKKAVEKLSFVTIRTPELYILYKKFYVDGTKVVPKTIQQDLTPAAIAYWFMDDGSTKDRQRQLGFYFITFFFYL